MLINSFHINVINLEILELWMIMFHSSSYCGESNNNWLVFTWVIYSLHISGRGRTIRCGAEGGSHTEEWDEQTVVDWGEYWVKQEELTLRRSEEWKPAKWFFSSQENSGQYYSSSTTHVYEKVTGACFNHQGSNTKRKYARTMYRHFKEHLPTQLKQKRPGVSHIWPCSHSN